MEGAVKARQEPFFAEGDFGRKQSPEVRLDRRQTLTRNRRHYFTEAVQLRQGGVHIGRDPQALKFFMDDRRREDAMLAEQITPNLWLIQAFDLYVGDGAHLRRIERSIEANFGNVFELIHPVSREIAQPCLLSPATDAVVKQHRFTDGQFRRGGVRADLFKLANVRPLLLFSREERPDFSYLVALNKEHSSTFWRVQPFVQRGSEVITIQVRLFEIELRE